MSGIQLTIRLPETLVERARNAGIPLTDDNFATLIEAELVRAQAVNVLRDAMQKLQGSLTPEEIDAELEKAKD
jgi:hypothetical protein